jgi:hypothetical protein
MDATVQLRIENWNASPWAIGFTSSRKKELQYKDPKGNQVGVLKQQNENRRDTEFTHHSLFHGYISCFPEMPILGNPITAYAMYTLKHQ